MAEKINEQLSALVDGEYQQAEFELLYRRVINDEDLRNRWQRYHMVGDSIRQHLPETVTLNFSERVMAAIEATHLEHSQETVELRARAPWLKPAIGFALAASVAAVAVVSIDLSPDTNAPELAETQPLQDQTIPQAPANLDTPDFDQKLNAYLAGHSEYVSMSGVSGVIPYVRMVGYQASR